VKSSLKVEVTQADIDKGIPGSVKWCAVARAVRHAMPKATNIKVGGFYITWCHDGKAWEYTFPQRVSQKIVNFDCGGKIKPFSFNIPLRKVVRL